MAWQVEYTDEFEEWWETLSDHEQELRTQSRGNPLRTFFAFDPRRTAILLIGGDKTGDGRFYERMIPIADALYDDHLEDLKREGN